MSAEQPPLTADPETIREWLDAAFAHADGQLSIAASFEGKLKYDFFSTTPEGLTAAVRYAAALDRRKPQGIYYQSTTLRERPAKGRGGEADTHCLTHLWADGDYGTIGHKPGLDDLEAPPHAEAALKVYAESGLPEPTGYAKSGGGLNGIWLLTEAHIISDEDDRARVKELTTGLQTILQAQAFRYGWSWDSGVGNLDRLMKLPGTVNRKPDCPERPTGMQSASGVLYDLAELSATVTELLPTARKIVARADAEKQVRKAQRTGAPVPPPRRERPAGLHSGDGPLDVLADRLDFTDVLQPHGFTYEGTHSDGRDRWKRPARGGDSPSSAYSLLCDDHVAVNWSERSDLPVGAQPAGHKLTIGTLWAHLNYAGDTSEAASDILRAAAGRDTRGAAGKLPRAVLDEVKRRCMDDGRRTRINGSRPEFTDDPWDGPPEEPPDGESAERADRLPDAFWNGTPALGQIRQMAQARRTSPDAVLHAALARTAAMADPTVRIDSGIHQPATLCWYCGLFGPSGAGKGQAEKTAKELTPFPAVDLAYIDISTGQGVIAAYLEMEADPDDESGKKVPVQKRTRGYALATEGSVLDAMAQMSAAATLNGVLCKAWMSERQGTSNAEMERRRVLPEDAYTLSMSLGVQEEPAAKLLEMGSIGLPQRLAWAHATLGPDTPKERPATTGPVTVTTRGGGETPVTTWVSTLRNVTMSVPERVTQELDELTLTISFGRGTEAPLDTHEPLWRLKCAALLALLHGRTSVTDDDWDMARTMWQTSRTVRGRVQESAQRRTQAQLDARRAEAVLTAVESQAAVYEAVNGVHPSVENVAKRAHRYLTRKGGEVPVRDVNRACIAKTDREKYRASGADDSLWTAALRYGCERGWLAPLADGALLAAGSVAPE